MITVLIHYKEWKDSGFAMVDGSYVKKSKVVEVLKLTELNEMFENITKIDVLHRVN